MIYFYHSLLFLLLESTTALSLFLLFCFYIKIKYLIANFFSPVWSSCKLHLPPPSYTTMLNIPYLQRWQTAAIVSPLFENVSLSFLVFFFSIQSTRSERGNDEASRCVCLVLLHNDDDGNDGNLITTLTSSPLQLVTLPQSRPLMT